jgi:hypothetical protein
MNKLMFLGVSAAIAFISIGVSDVFGTKPEVFHYLAGLAVGLWIYPLAEND